VSHRTAVAVLILLVLVGGTSACATDIFIAPTGNDTTGDGSIGNPYATLNKAATVAVAGDTIQVRAGSYGGGVAANCISAKHGSPGAYITVNAYDGDLTAEFINGLGLRGGCSYIRLTGLSMTNNAQNANHPIHICSNPDICRSDHIEVLRCRFHDWVGPSQIKSQDTDYLLYEDCETYNTVSTDPQSFTFDLFWCSYSTVRRAYIHDFLTLGIMNKAGCEYNVYESNVIVNPSNQPALGMLAGSCANRHNPNLEYHSAYLVMRNNIVKEAQRAAVSSHDAYYLYVYNNLFADCGDVANGYGYVLQHSNGQSCIFQGTKHYYVYNNIFYDTGGDMYAAYKYDNGDIEDWTTGYNCYWNNGNSIPDGAGGVVPNPNTETGRQIGNPNLSLSGTPNSWQTWVDYYRPTASSALIIDTGTSAAGSAPRPAVLADIEGTPRPRGAGWDIGPYEYPNGTAVPDAEFLSDKSWGTPPATFQFTDYTSGGPTSWSWTFGDGLTSTVQHPSHTYTASNVYTVALTATNSAGSNTETKTNYITVKPLDAEFTADQTWGPSPLAVNFTDQSTNSPTAWSWSFGDGGSSTLQNPSHTYSGVSYYSVQLTASNVNGNDTETKINYLAVCSEVMVYPSAWWSWHDPPDGDLHVVTGSLTDLQVEDGVTMEVAPDSTSRRYSMFYQGTTTYTANQVHGLTVEYVGRATDPATPRGFAWATNVQGGHDNIDLWDPWGTAYHTTRWRTTNAAKYMLASGLLEAVFCGCPYGTGPYTILSDLMRWKLCLKPTGTPAPVADFTGTPTVGLPGMTVNFTDTSVNTPTAWSWDFGDSGTSTAQNPSHTYAAGGSYTVSLTATNAGGSDVETKTDYISVCTEVTLFANTMSQFIWGGPVIAGSLADVRTDNEVYHVTHVDPAQYQNECRRYYYPSAYAPADVARLTLEYEWKGSRDDTPNYQINILKQGPGGPGDVIPENLIPQHLHGTTEGWETWYSDSPATYIRDDNSVWLDSCGCPNGNPNAFSTFIDVARIKLWVKPGATISAPTANFTGAPTSGAPPLTVSFTDSSTGSPAFWAWDFGDGASSTVQSPSHTYSNNGTYSVALTVNNGYGSHTLTRSNYITVAQPPAPTFVAAGTVASGTGAITPALPAGRQSNDILLLFLETANQAISIANQNGGTWTQVTNSPQSVGTAGGSNGTRLTVFWSRYNGTQGAPTTSDSGNHQLGRIIALRGAATSGDPCNITAGNIESTVDTSGAIAGATTTVVNTLVVAAIATALPDASGTANFSAWANGDLTSVTERTDNTVTAGNGGGLGLATGVKVTAGAYGNTTVTCATASTKAMMSIAIKP